MMFKVLLPLTLLFFTLKTNALIQVPLIGSGDASVFDFSVRFNFSIGTPGQQIEITLSSNDQEPTLYLKDGRTYDDGFNPDKSSTYREGDPVKDGNDGYEADDVFSLNGSKIGRKPFEILFDRYRGETPGKMGIKRDTSSYCVINDCSTFVESVLKSQKEPVLVFIYDKPQIEYSRRRKSLNFTGQLIFGEKPSQFCQNDWKFVKEQRKDGLGNNFPQWSFFVKGFSAGKASYSYFQQVSTLSFQSTKILIPQNIYKFVMNALGADKYDRVLCNTTEELVFNLDGNDFRIAPEIYVIKVNRTERCYTYIGANYDNKNFVMPVTAFAKNYCFLLNYTKDKYGIGFSKRIN